MSLLCTASINSDQDMKHLGLNHVDGVHLLWPMIMVVAVGAWAVAMMCTRLWRPGQRPGKVRACLALRTFVVLLGLHSR